VRDLVRTHQERAGLLLWATIALTAVVVVAFLALPAPSALASRRYDHVGVEQAWLPPVLMVLLVAVAVIALVAVVLTGDSGARAVWSNG
jgi:succinate dehydrogenase hydrophobic anchor subunit